MRKVSKPGNSEESQRIPTGSGIRGCEIPEAINRKIKCSGDKPCSRCQKTGRAAECKYADRDRKIRVDESQELHAEKDKRVRETPIETITRPSDHASSTQQSDLVENEAWFQTQDSSSLPLYINEAACIAFATQLCQCLRPTDSLAMHIPPRNYTDEETLSSLNRADTPWPRFADAQLLVRTALGHINPGFHLVRTKEVLDGLRNVYEKGNFNNSITKCKYFALFAVGKVYSIGQSSSSPSVVPGTEYFARASYLIQIIPERPSMAHIESLLLLFLNRIHSSYLLTGNALRLSLALGLNYNVPRSHNLSPIEREHRVRIWWSIYILDRFWGSKLGFPVQIHDDDIHVDLPSRLSCAGYEEHFSEVAYQIAAIELARITGRATKEIYTRKKSPESLLQREQKFLIQLRHWVNSLPEDLQLSCNRPHSKHTILLHLQFNYSVIIAIRPVLLNYLACESRGENMTLDQESKQTFTTLSVACIRAAQYSLKLCLEEWTNGSLDIFGYSFPAFIFSSALVLIVSSLLHHDNATDITALETATEMLKTLSASNNLAAKDLYDHLERVSQCLHRSYPSRFVIDDRVEHPAFEIQDSFTTQKQPPSDLPGFEKSVPESASDNIELNVSSELTSGGILHCSMMQDFLTKPTSEVGLLELPEMRNVFDVAFLGFDHVLEN
ncbi:fungal-specific transcription factor domain-containing protein [Penicillium malachiteum]|uniref:fungal-specific transcription factor domain-containing protein n=1 Tax=Penicillium malachiteum TaxID=1324776 RepID=UPI002547DB63|nr:fungal-specific transcription factor domain-containing protein [Penicillium malachiteum]KAJ5713982.1 fungal-specific transcription factor domain-containing protein [Penicillium malachiteum]